MAGEIFISYRRADAAWARLLYDQLKGEGVEAWYDSLVGPGQDWRIATAKALEASSIFVLLFSENAAQSSDIAKELAAAVLERKLIIPVRLENIAPKGAFLYELASRNWINAYENREGKLAELARGLARLVRSGARDESVLPFERSVARQPAPRERKLAIAGAATLAIVAALGAAAWELWPEKHWTAESSRRFIGTLAAEGTPAFSPDGKMLAYIAAPYGAPRKIYVKSVAGGDEIKVTGDAWSDGSPSWSSDGTHLAYLGLERGKPCHVMITTVPAGETREVARCHEFTGFGTGSAVWRPNSPFVYFMDQKGAAAGRYITQLNVETGERSELKRPTQWLWGLSASPNGKSLLFLDMVSQTTYRVVVRDLESGQEKQLGVATGDFAGVADGWSEDSRAALVAVGGSGNQTIRAYPVNGGAPYTVYSTSTNIYSMSVGAAGRLALETDLSRRNLARLRPAPSSEPDIVDPAGGNTSSPTFAPDGTLGFLSNRSGSDAIWLKHPGAAPIRLLDGQGNSLRKLRFSPDGKRLTVTRVTDKSAMIRVLTVDGTDLAGIETGIMGIGSPTWTPDGKSLVLLDSATNCYAKVDVDRPASRTKLTAMPATPNVACDWDGISYRSNGIFAIRNDKPGIWRLDESPRLINEKYPGRNDAAIAFRGDDVLVPDLGAPGSVPRIFAQPAGGGPDKLLGYAPNAFINAGIAANPVSGEVLYIAEVGRDSNIDLLALVRH